MGCNSSQPRDDEGGNAQAKRSQQQQQQQHQAAGPTTGGAAPPSVGAGKSENTRARRLSYVAADATRGVQAESQQPGGKPAATPGAQQSSSTRARRLSYVTNDPKANGKVPGPVDGELESALAQDEGGMADGAVVGGQKEVKSDSKKMQLNVACMSRAGREPGFKKTNQDNCFAFEKYITEDQSLFGALDGHGPNGHLVSGYVKQHLPIILVNHLTTEKSVQNTLTSGFVEVDKSLGNSRIDCEFSGTTAVVSYLKGRTLTTAWVGDSRGVMARETKDGWEAIDLTDDHKPTNPEEKARILQQNGRVERLVDEMGQPMGPYRVWLQYAWIPGLAMSRALGDVLAHQVGVSSEPDHSVVELTDQDRFIILASDGVWEFITSKEAVEIAAQYDTAEESCRQLVDEAYQRWLVEEEGVVDDITAVIVRFKMN